MKKLSSRDIQVDKYLHELAAIGAESFKDLLKDSMKKKNPKKSHIHAASSRTVKDEVIDQFLHNLADSKCKSSKF